MTQVIRIGIVGGGAMAKAHVIGLRSIASYFGNQEPRPEIAIVADVNAAAAQEAAQRFSIERWTPDWREVVEDDSIDAISVVAPNDVHAAISVAALEAGKHVICEKPLSHSVEASRQMVEAAHRSNKVTVVNLNYRQIPAIRYAKRLIESGEIGQVFNFRGSFLQDWAADVRIPRSWKFEAQHAGGGAMHAVGCHVVDLAHYMVGDIDAVIGLSRTHVTERPMPQARSTFEKVDHPTTMVAVDTEDVAAMLVRFRSGEAIGTIEASRITVPRKTQCYVEVNGTQGTIVFDYEHMNELQVSTRSSALDGLTRVVIGPKQDEEQFWSLGGLGIGFAETVILQMRGFLRAISDGSVGSPSFADGLRAQQVVEAALHSARTGNWQEVL